MDEYDAIDIGSTAMGRDPREARYGILTGG